MSEVTLVAEMTGAGGYKMFAQVRFKLIDYIRLLGLLVIGRHYITGRLIIRRVLLHLLLLYLNI